MAVEVERLLTLLEARITGYERELKKASQTADREARNIERRFNKMNDTLGRQFAASAGAVNKALGAIGAGVSVGAIVNLARSSLQLADNLQDTAEQLGVSTRALQVYRFGAAEAGIEAGKMDQAVLKLNTAIGEAASGDEAAQKKFKALGIAFTDSAGRARSAEDVLADLADVIQSLPTPAERAAAAALLLGDRAGPRLAALLSQGAEGLKKLEKAADDAGQIMADETVQRLAKAQREIEKFVNWLTIATGETLEFLGSLQADTATPQRLAVINREIENTQKALADLRDGGPLSAIANMFGGEEQSAKRLNELLAERARIVEKLFPAQGHAGKGIQFTPKPTTKLDLGGGSGGEDEDKKFQKILDDLNEIAQKQREATAARIADGEFEIRQQQLKLEGKEREAEIEAAIRDARKENPSITNAEIDRVRALTGARYDLLQSLTDEEQRKKNIEDADKRLNDLMALRAALQEQLNVYVAQGNTEKIKETEAALAGVNASVAAAIDGMIVFWQSVGGPEADAAIAKLQALKLQLADTGQTAGITGAQINNMIASHGVDALDQFAQSIANNEASIKSLGQAFAQFAADFLRDIARMIAQQAILNALGAGPTGDGGAGGFIATAIGSLFHSGGIAGRGKSGRRVPAAAFIGAPRFHGGGVAGMRADEVPAILQKGELITSVPQVRKARQAASQQGGGMQPKFESRIYNLFDEQEVFSRAAGTPAGVQALINVVRGNQAAFNGALGGNRNR